jgi:isoquinoline 1-oxidoreductase
MAAEELGVALGSIDMVMGDTQLCPWDMGTFGSMSTRFFGPALRGAAAEAKAVLLELASQRLQVPKERLSVTNGVVHVAGNENRRVTFGQLARGKRIERHLTGKPSLRDFAGFTVSGKPVKRLDARAKVTGKARYAGDIRVPGMLYARILRPPAHGATLKSVDTSAAEGIPGVTVVNRDGMVAVLHADPEGAAKALAAVKADFDVPPATVDTDTIFDHLLRVAPPPEERERKGDLTEGERTAAALFEHRYENGYGAHAPMETHTALASVEGDKATVWAGTQTPFPNQQQIAQAIGLALESPCRSRGPAPKSSSTTRSGRRPSSRSSRASTTPAGSRCGTTTSILQAREALSSSTTCRTT